MNAFNSHGRTPGNEAAVRSAHASDRVAEIVPVLGGLLRYESTERSYGTEKVSDEKERNHKESQFKKIRNKESYEKVSHEKVSYNKRGAAKRPAISEPQQYDTLWSNLCFTKLQLVIMWLLSLIFSVIPRSKVVRKKVLNFHK